jgi:hypothetical protein
MDQDQYVKVTSFLENITRGFVFVPLVLLVFAVPGDILLFKVYSTKMIRKLSVSFYFKSMALISLMNKFNWITSFYNNLNQLFFRYKINFYFEDHHIVSCKIFYYSFYTLPSIFIWLQAAASFDRMRTIIFPSKFLFTTKRKFKLTILTSIIVYNMTFYLEVFIRYYLYEWYVDTITGI